MNSFTTPGETCPNCGECSQFSKSDNGMWKCLHCAQLNAPNKLAPSVNELARRAAGIRQKHLENGTAHHCQRGPLASGKRGAGSAPSEGIRRYSVRLQSSGKLLALDPD